MKKRVIDLLGNHGTRIIAPARGIDNRSVGSRIHGQSIGTEQTFQTVIVDSDYLKDNYVWLHLNLAMTYVLEDYMQGLLL